MCIVIIHIMESPVSDIFSICVFNNIMEVTFIFSPPRFFADSELESYNLLDFNDIGFSWIIVRNR